MVTERVLVAGHTTFCIAATARLQAKTHFAQSSIRKTLVCNVTSILSWTSTQCVKDQRIMGTILVLSLITVFNAMPPNAPSANKVSGKSISQESVFFPPKIVLKDVPSAPPINALLVKLDTRHNHGQFA